MEYEVTIDFGDNAVQAPHICRSLSDLGLYLERVPSLLGFELNGTATIRIKHHARLSPLIPYLEN